MVSRGWLPADVTECRIDSVAEVLDGLEQGSRVGGLVQVVEARRAERRQSTALTDWRDCLHEWWRWRRRYQHGQQIQGDEDALEYPGSISCKLAGGPAQYIGRVGARESVGD